VSISCFTGGGPWYCCAWLLLLLSDTPWPLQAAEAAEAALQAHAWHTAHTHQMCARLILDLAQLTGYGGLVVQEFVSAQQIKDELKFNRNPVVIYQFACGAAGTSETDKGEIGIREATKRVAETAKPFLKVGAGAYYADNYIGGVNNFLELFLSGKTIGDVYQETASEWCTIEVNRLLNDVDLNSNLSIEVSSSGGEQKEVVKTINGKQVKKIVIEPKEYSVAFVGRKELTVNDVFLVTGR
jgi:hypothetical protein